MYNTIDYSHFTREELFSLVNLKFNPELLSCSDFENLYQLFIDFADISEEALLNEAISRSFNSSTEPFSSSDVENSSFYEDFETLEPYEKDRSKRLITRKMRRKHPPKKDGIYRFYWIFLKKWMKSEDLGTMHTSLKRDARKDFKDQMSLLEE